MSSLAANSDYVKLATGQLVLKSDLRGSALYASMLDSSDIVTELTSQSDSELPVPEAISKGVMDDYLAYLSRDKRKHTADQVKANLRACSLIDDIGYLELCVKRFLLNYDACKDVLQELDQTWLEQVYLLIPKDMWPDRLQDDDKMLTKWLHKHFYSQTNFSSKVKRMKAGKRHSYPYVSFAVNDLVYTYVFIQVGSSDNIKIVSNLTTEDEAKYILGELENVNYGRSYKLIGHGCSLSHDYEKPILPIITLRDIEIDPSSNTRICEMYCWLDKSYDKTRQRVKVWYSKGQPLAEPDCDISDWTRRSDLMLPIIHYTVSFLITIEEERLRDGQCIITKVERGWHSHHREQIANSHGFTIINNLLLQLYELGKQSCNDDDSGDVDYK